MAQAEVIKSIVKPPFASYDIVVYFGCGLFSLPFINHYVVEPFGLQMPAFTLHTDIPFASSFISTLSMLFAVYILGHMIAFTGSQLIEKAADTFVGKTSDAVLATSGEGFGYRDPAMRNLIKARTAEAWANARLITGFRAMVHAPVWPLYGLIYWIGMFGFYGARVPPYFFDAVRANMKHIGFEDAVPGSGHAWFKTLEAYVTNCSPTATARMYNYLIISGLFRSMALIFLAAIWAEWFYVADRIVTRNVHISLMMTKSTAWSAEFCGLALLYTVYVFSFWSYLKFQRRYVEEAIFAFGIIPFPKRSS